MTIDSEAGFGIIIDTLSSIEAAVQDGKKRLADLCVKAHGYDIEAMKWEERVNDNGRFRMCRETENVNFKALREDLEKHGRHMNIGNEFFWLFLDRNAIGRKTRVTKK